MMKLHTIIILILISLLGIYLYQYQTKTKTESESFMDDLSYQNVRYKLAKAHDYEIKEAHANCRNFCKNIKSQSDCELLCDQLAEDKSDDHRYQYLTFGSSLDKHQMPSVI